MDGEKTLPGIVWPDRPRRRLNTRGTVWCHGKCPSPPPRSGNRHVCRDRRRCRHPRRRGVPKPGNAPAGLAEPGASEPGRARRSGRRQRPYHSQARRRCRGAAPERVAPGLGRGPRAGPAGTGGARRGSPGGAWVADGGERVHGPGARDDCFAPAATATAGRRVRVRGACRFTGGTGPSARRGRGRDEDLHRLRHGRRRQDVLGAALGPPGTWPIRGWRALCELTGFRPGPRRSRSAGRADGLPGSHGRAAAADPRGSAGPGRAVPDDAGGQARPGRARQRP